MKKQKTDPSAAAEMLLGAIQPLSKPVLLAIDGRCGSGKTTLAKVLGADMPEADGVCLDGLLASRP